LFLKPGKLTNEYMAGRRTQYLHPVKMYIFISLVYFVLLFKSGFEPVKVTHTNKAETKKELDSTNRVLDNIAKDPEMPDYAKKALLLKKKQNEEDSKKDYNYNIDNNGNSTFIGPLTDDTSYQQYAVTQQKLPENKRDGFFERLYNKKAFLYKEKYGSRAKEVFLDELQHNVPKMMFLMLPLSALILSVTFRKNRKYYVEHLIYTFHLHCFLFLFLAFTMLIEIILPASKELTGWLNFVATIGIIWYLYKSLRVVYQRSPLRTVSKLLGTACMYLLLFSFCFFTVFIITALLMA